MSIISSFHMTALIPVLVLAQVLARAAPSDGVTSGTNAHQVLSCAKPVYDFGTLDNEETIEHSFVLRNEGTAVLELGKTYACCGSVAELSASTVPPGQETVLKIRLPLKGRSGNQTLSFYVRTNRSARPLYELRIRGTALAKVDVQPSGVMLGAVEEDAAAEKTVSIICRSNIVFGVTNVECSSRCVAAKYLGVSGNVHRVSIVTVPPLPSGILRATARVLTDHGKYQVIEIPVLARVTKDIVVFPNEIRLTRTSRDRIAGSWYAVVRSLKRTPFKIVGTETPAKGIEVVCSPMASGGYKVEIRGLLSQSDMDGKQIILKTDVAKATEVAIPIHAGSADARELQQSSRQ